MMLLGPTPVAIHDDSYVLGNRRGWLFFSHAEKFAHVPHPQK